MRRGSCRRRAWSKPRDPGPAPGRRPSPPAPLSKLGEGRKNETMASRHRTTDRIRGTTSEIDLAAKRLRKEGTAAEEMIWKALRARKLAGLKFRRQQPMGPFVLDFLC